MHPVWHGAQHHLMVRAFRPDAVSVEVVRMDTHDICARLDPRHPEGFFEGRVADLEHPFPYLLRVTYLDGSIDFRPDPYAFPPDPHRLRPPSHQRRIPSAPLRSNGCAPYLTGGNRWRVVRRLGARSSTRQHRRGFQPVGWTQPRDEGPRRERCVGAVRTRPWGRRPLQVRNQGTGQRRSPQDRALRLQNGASATDRRHREHDKR